MQTQCVRSGNDQNRNAIQVRDDLLGDVVKKMCVLESSFRNLKYDKAASTERMKRVLRSSRIAEATSILIKLRDRRKVSYGEALASFITRLATHDKYTVLNSLKRNDHNVKRIPRTEVLLQQCEGNQPGTFIFLPFVEDRDIKAVRRPLNTFKNGQFPAGSVEILCEMMENPGRFVGRRFLADGDEVTIDEDRYVPSFSIREDGTWVIEPVHDKALPTPNDRALTLILPD
ncbi:hypothetical protein A3F55_00745 [Candidatus Adlerbacteria bacterium RIFCSPHIGHO2_12_FULL_53_18]|uniref:Uncharacterized protein n=1 Tax=Candidatus Adlerbacteria bacterium RIFCSPHIGHO2_12_FULL_53_18 TaxID=1797242 RepID=A0A1F4XRI4_9BACT|nr:MAG: hypothetical protein A3F55_00745 [Candidatus Adlerbacteria bacterium RIFCSPHIGHO2_12_FULL_53_18]